MTATTESAESRLYAAGFTRQLEWWVAPDGSRVLSMADAIAGLASGEIQPGGPTMSLPYSAAALPDELVTRSARRRTASRRHGCSPRRK